MRDIADIPAIPDRATRLAEVTVDCYGREEELSTFDVYLSDALRPPFAATWRDPDEPGHTEPVTVLGWPTSMSGAGSCCRCGGAAGKRDGCWPSRSGPLRRQAPTRLCWMITARGSSRVAWIIDA